MSTRTVFLARLIGLSLVVMAASMVLNKATIAECITSIVHEPTLLFTFGFMALGAGLAIVIGHNVWSGGAAAIIVTIFGWVLLIKSAVLLFLSPTALVGLYAYVRFSDFYNAYAVAIAVIGLFLVYSGFAPARLAVRNAKA